MHHYTIARIEGLFAKIEQFFAAQGLPLLYPETHSILQQIILFSNASHVVGPTVGITFPPTDCKIMIFASDAFYITARFFLRYDSNEKMYLLTGHSEIHTDPKYAGNTNGHSFQKVTKNICKI